MACYGLRPDEVFYCEVDPNPPHACKVFEGKTGSRTVMPLNGSGRKQARIPLNLSALVPLELEQAEAKAWKLAAQRARSQVPLGGLEPGEGKVRAHDHC